MKLVVALDLPTPSENLNLASKLFEPSALSEKHRNNLLLKVGLNTFIAGGSEFVQKLARCDIVLDLKLNDIPNTVASAAERIADFPNVKFFTVHASAGRQALGEARVRLTGKPNAPKMLAVTLLTSLSDDDTKRMYRRFVKPQVKSLLDEAVHGGADGIVCSPMELGFIDGWAKISLGRIGPAPQLLKMIPGIELKPRADDQKRKGGLQEVIRGNADMIVVGRPIYQNPAPAEFTARLLNNIEQMEHHLAQFVKLSCVG